MRLTFGSWLARVVVPLFGILAALVFLLVAAVDSVVEGFADRTRWHLFFVGLNLYLASIVWGTWVNGRPVPRAQSEPEMD